MATSVDQLVQAAGQLANAGRWEEAERAWLEVRRLQPRHPKALFSLGIHAFRRGETHSAYQLLIAARTEAPADTLVLMALANVCRERGDLQQEREAIDAALAVDAYFLPGLLARADWFERVGEDRSAATTYANALKVAPPSSHWPAALKAQLEHARAVAERHTREYDRYLQHSLAQAQAALPQELAGRWRESISIMAGRTRPYHAECNQLHVPRLPATPFFDRSLFPWASALEAHTDVIRSELLAVLQADRDRFSPYIAYRPGDPVNQWHELNHSPRWSAFHLWRGGIPVAENMQRCPQTARLLTEASLADIPGLCPNAMFSALAPGTHIPPHHGETNARVVVHLPLIVPEGCLYRVGFERRHWKAGEILVFDDTIEHEARNDSDELRVVLLFDIWNPLLEPLERDMVRAMTAAARRFKEAGEPAAGA